MTTTYADSTRCPDCRALLPQAPTTCPECRIPLTGETARELFATFQHADGLLAVLRAARLPEPVTVGAGLPTDAGTGSRLAGVTPYPVAQHPTPEPAGTRVRGASVPQILLSLGALCLLVAAVTFLAVAWSWLGVSGRTLVLVGLTGTSFAATLHLHRRGLRTASEALAVVALGLVALDVVGARHAGWLGDADDARVLLLTGVVVATAALVLLVTTAHRPLVAPALVAPVAALLAGIGGQTHAGSPAPMLVTALVLLALARVGTLLPSRVLTLTAAGTAALPWVYSVVSGFASALEDPTFAHLWGHAAAWPLAVAVALAATCGVVSGVPVLTRPGCAVAALLAGYVVTLPVLDNGATAAVTSLLVVTAIWTTVAILAPTPWRAPAAGAAVGSAVAPVVAALSLLAMSARAVLDAGAPFSSPFDVTVAPTAPEVAPWVLLPALLVLAALACSVASLAAPLRRTTWLAAGAGAAVVGLVATLPLYDVPLAAVVGLLVSLGAAGLLGAERLSDQTALAARGAGLVLLALATVAALPNDVLTAGVLGVVTVAAGVLMQRTDLCGDVAAAVLPLSLAGLVWSSGEVAGVPEVYRGVPILLLVGALAIWRPQAELEAGAAVAGTVAAAGSVAAAADGQLALAVYLTVAGALVTASALVHPDRRFLAWPGGLLLAAATWVRLAQLGVHAPEAYTLPTALVLVALGCWRMWHDDHVGSLTVLAPGLTLATVPSLLVALDEPASLRALLLGAACLGLVLAGVAMRWSAPLVVGSVVGVVLVLRMLAPYAAVVPTWLVIGLSGTVLTLVGITWESRLRDLRRASRYVGSLR
jgi:hypothetical protein